MATASLDAGSREAVSAQIAVSAQRLHRQREALRTELAGIMAAAELEPPDDEHDPDGTTAYERAQVTSLLAEVDARLVLLQTARDRVADEGFGRCVRCQEPIGFERLMALPEATECVACASRTP
jgi:DnaK suppressor protein